MQVVDGLLLLYALSAGFSIAVAQQAGTIAGLIWLVCLWRSRGGAGRPGDRFPVLAPHLALALWTLVAIGFSAAPLLGLEEIRTEWARYLLMVTVADRLRDGLLARRVSTLWIVALFLVVASGLWQTLRQGIAFRIEGTLGHFMTYSEVVMLMALAVGGRALFTRRPVVRGLAAAVLVLAVAALILSQTRGAWLGFGAGAAVLAFVRDRRWLLALPVIGVLAFAAAPESTRARWNGILDLQDITTSERVFMWREGAAMTRDHPLVGLGPGNIRGAIEEYRLPDDPWLPERRWTHLHSNVVQIAAERGLPGLIAWIAIWVGFWIAAVARRPGPDDPQREPWAVGLAATAAFLVAGLTEYCYGDTEVVYLLYFLMGGALIRDRPATGDTAAAYGILSGER